MNIKHWYRPYVGCIHNRKGRWYSDMNKLKVLFAMLAVLLGVGFATTTAQAREINSETPKNLVDNFKFLADTLNQGEISALKVSFSEKYDGNLKVETL